MNQRLYTIVLFVLSAFVSLAQDIHFSQFDASLLNLSPAFTGVFKGDYRLSTVYRSQWQSVPVSYSTFNLNGETRLKPRSILRDAIGVGFIFNNDRAGDANYGTTQFYVTGSYIWMVKKDSSLMVSVGTSLGWCQVGFNYSKMTFDTQFDGVRFNNGLISGEQFASTQTSYFDFNNGAAIFWQIKPRHRLQYGFGIYHVRGPVTTFQGDLKKLDYRMSHYLSYTTPISEHSDIVAELMYTQQGKYLEVIPHISLKRFIDKATGQAVLAGLCWRTRDAAILRMGYHQGALQSGIAYDINISKFTAATNRRGAFEIYLNYVFKNKPTFIAKNRYCPTFL